MPPNDGRRIHVDTDRCLGTGNCCVVAPGTFEVGSEGVAVVVDPFGDELDRVRAAAARCPTGALQVVLGTRGSP